MAANGRIQTADTKHWCGFILCSGTGVSTSYEDCSLVELIYTSDRLGTPRGKPQMSGTDVLDATELTSC